VAEHDGDGWARCGQGHIHWGRFGAVGLLAYSRARQGGERGGEPGGARVLLVRRSRWGQHGGTWGPPGGARDSDEPPVTAALREAAEECGLPPGAVRIQGVLLDDHGGWSYQTFVAEAQALPPVRAASREITEAAWLDAATVGSLPLHPSFAERWPVLSGALAPLAVIVDAANVMGARADGWWRDRAAAALRLHAELSALSERGIASLPEALAAPPLDRWFPGIVLVVEGAARAAVFGPAGPVRVVLAPGSGDDAVVRETRALPGRRLVVTADRELRRRCESAGASVTGPRWLLGLL
jgi:8-oxo-dGTP pyrophosphatase MutT (NUDIX family)